MKQEKANVLRKFGIKLVGDIPWGTHLCQFYETKEDLIDILVPYFAEGLRNNEFCMWVTSPPLEVEEAKQALKKAVPELDQHIQKGQIEILPYTEWYLLGGAFDSDRVMQGWVQKEKAARDCGFDGLRLTGNTFWLERNGWRAFAEYEEEVNNAIGKYRMIAVCTYSLSKCNANEVIDVVKNHQFALIKRSGKWELIESSEAKKIRSALLRSEKKFSALYSSMIEGVAFHDVVYDRSGKAVDYIVTDVNPSYEKITGLSKKQAIGKRASELYGTGEPPYLDIYAKVASSGKPASFETYFPPMQKNFSISVFSPSKGKFTTVFHDITQHRQAEEALRNVALFPEQNPFPILRVARDGTLLYANKSSKCLLDLWGCQNAQRVPEQVLQQVVQALDTQQITQLEVACGSVTYSFAIAPIAQLGYTNLYGRDVTERKKAEQALQKAKRDWERTFDSVPDLIAILDNQHRIVRANRAMAHRLGVTPEQCIGLNCFKCVHETSQPPEFCPHTRTLQDGQEHIAEVHEDRLGGDFLVSTTPLMDERGQMIGSVHVARDIAEIKRAEGEIKRLNEFQKRVFESIKDELMVIDTHDFTVLAANKALLENVKMKEEEVIEKHCYAVTHGKSTRCSPPNDTCPVAEMLRTGNPVTVEHTHYDREGNPYYVEVSASPITDEKGNTIQAVHLARDITKRKQVEQALRLSEINLNRAQAVAKAGSWQLDVRRNELLWSDETYRMFGIPMGTPLTYETFLGIVHPEDKSYVDEKWNAALRGEPYDIEHRIVVNGEIKWVREKAELELDKNGALRGGFGTVQDITERKRTEQELFDSLRESQLRQSEISALLKASKTVLRNREFEVSARTLFDSCKELLGATAGYVALLSEDGKDNIVLFLESGGLPCSVDPSLPMPVRGLRAETYNTGKVAIENSFPKSKWNNLLPSGHVNLENVLFAPLTVNGKTAGIIGLANKPGGFTERDAQMALAFGEIASIALINSQMLEMLEENAKKLKAQSEHLEELVEERTTKLGLSELYARSLIEASLDPLVTINVEGKITDVNKATELATGCSRDKLIGSDFSEYFTEPEKARIGYKKVFAEGFVRDYPLAIRHKSGKTIDVLYNATIYRNAQGEIQGVFAAARDIAELKKAEKAVQESIKKLKDAERLAAIGATAGMVGHDMRNPLQSIISDVYLAKMDSASLPDSEEKAGLQESLEAIEKQTEYINKIVLDLQDFAKPLNPHAEETDIELIINELMMRNGVPQNIQTDVKVDAEAKTMMADPAYMKRIIDNLVSNAVQAMPNGGKLTLRAYREAGDIVITVEDTGVGIPEEAKPMLFQPLFSTKSKGQGFGLSVVKRLTEALNGTVTFESQEGKGAKFALHFPLPTKTDNQKMNI